VTSQSRTLPPATAATRIAPLLLATGCLAIAAGSQWLWRHRRQIGAALVTAVATTYSAGAWGRQHVEALAADSVRRLPSQPVAAVAPITATLAAAWGLVDRGTMTRERRAQRALLADIASYYGLEPRDLLRPIKRRYSAAALAAAIRKNEPTPTKGDDLVSKIMKAIDENNAYLKQRPNIITLSTQDFGIENIEFQLWIKLCRDYGWTVVE